MINCPMIRDELAAYQNGELSTLEAERISEHLRGCASCRMELELLRQTGALLRLRFAAANKRLLASTPTWQSRPWVAGPGSPRRRTTASRGSRLGMGAAALVLALIAALLFLPPVSARVGQLLGGWLGFSVPGTHTRLEIEGFSAFTPWAPAWLPAGFDLSTSGTHTAPGVDELLLSYTRGNEKLLLIQRKESTPAALPEGIAESWEGAQGVYVDTVSAIPAEIAAQFPGEMPHLLAWEQDGLRFELYANLAKETLLRTAQSLQRVER
jgi:hypothetical protein